jgi:hypothetical protein
MRKGIQTTDNNERGMRRWEDDEQFQGPSPFGNADVMIADATIFLAQSWLF